VSATIIDGKGIAASIREEIAAQVRTFTERNGRRPGLGVVLCGDDPASAVYVRNKQRAADRAGFDFRLLTPDASASTAQLLDLVGGLVADDTVDGILVQLPLPRQVDQDAVVNAVPPEKDADGFHPYNFGQLAEGRMPVTAPCTALGCMELLRRSDVPVSGSNAVVIGRSTTVGRPMALLLTHADATVTMCHSKTRDLAAVARNADILVAAIGRPGMITAGHVKPGACVIDVGITPTESGVVGDVDRASVEPVAGWLTPVPGGVGPMTIALLLRNTLALAEAHAARRVTA
jgi:methylenetetrahydrofolate dehydrogenase (NADP+)/methenyltetrahydrofolate cyclohydrolase